MIQLIPYASLGHASHGWLEARHHFSFAGYYNPQRTGFGTLLVVNDDRIAPQRGFGEHPHDNMEIITYVRQGAITHRDSLGSEGVTNAGDIQVMSAGTGVRHSEWNTSDDECRLYQIWIVPNRRGVTPRWEQRVFAKDMVKGSVLPLLVSGREEDAESGALFIHQDAAIYGGRLAAGAQVKVPVKYQAYVLASRGTMQVGGQRLQEGDAAEVTDEDTITVQADSDAEVLIIDIPQQ